MQVRTLMTILVQMTRVNMQLAALRAKVTVVKTQTVKMQMGVSQRPSVQRPMAEAVRLLERLVVRLLCVSVAQRLERLVSRSVCDPATTALCERALLRHRLHTALWKKPTDAFLHRLLRLSLRSPFRRIRRQIRITIRFRSRRTGATLLHLTTTSNAGRQNCPTRKRRVQPPRFTAKCWTDARS